MLLGHRYMDPSTGRFLTRDPVKDGRNWYGYCANNPLACADPDGLLPEWINKVIGFGKGIVKGINEGAQWTWKAIGVVLIVKPIAAFFEVMYEGAINSGQRLD